MTAGPPFFIVGCGRSGTSLLRSLLVRHPRVAIPLESLFLIDYLRAADARPLAELLPLMVREPEIREWGLNPSLDDFKECTSVASAIRRLHEIYAEEQGKETWGQKTPRFVRSLPLLAKHFPDARFVHLVRDPRAVVSSLIRSDVHRSNAYHGSIRWVQDVSRGLDFEAENPGRVLRLRYEDLVGDVEASVGRLLEFLEITLDAELDLAASAGDEGYSAFYDQIHANLQRAPTDAFVERWRKSLSQDQIQVVEALAGERMAELGYSRDFPAGQVSSRQLLKFRLSRLAGVFLQLGKYMRYRPRYFVYLLWRKSRLGLLGDFLGEANY